MAIVASSQLPCTVHKSPPWSVLRSKACLVLMDVASFRQEPYAQAAGSAERLPQERQLLPQQRLLGVAVTGVLQSRERNTVPRACRQPTVLRLVLPLRVVEGHHGRLRLAVGAAGHGNVPTQLRLQPQLPN